MITTPSQIVQEVRRIVGASDTELTIDAVKRVMVIIPGKAGKLNPYEEIETLREKLLFAEAELARKDKEYLGIIERYAADNVHRQQALSIIASLPSRRDGSGWENFHGEKRTAQEIAREALRK